MEEVQNKPGGYLFHLSFLEMLSRYSLSFVGLSYIFGFIIVNSYLASFGLVNIGIIKAKYIAAGVVFLVFVSLCGLLLYPMAFFFSKQRAEFKIRDVFWSIGSLVVIQQLLLHIAPETLKYSWIDKLSFNTLTGFLVIIAGMSFVFAIVSPFLKKLSRFSDPSYFLAMAIYAYLSFEPAVIWVLVFLLGFINIGARFVSDLMDVLSKKKRFAGMAVNTVFVVSITLAMCQVYATRLYPKIENKYGGGKPVDVTLLLGKEMEPLSGLLFEDNQEPSQTIKDVTLIDEDGDYFFIQKKVSKQIKTFRIKKSLVDAIIHGKK